MKKEIKIQQENIQTLIKLASKNPELKIVPMVETEVCSSDDYNYWTGNWGNAELDECYCFNGRIYFKSSDEEDLVDQYAYDLGDNPKYKEMQDEEFYKIVEEKVNNLPWEKVIVVYINAI